MSGFDYLSDEIKHNIISSEVDGGVWITDHPDYVNEEIKSQPVLPVGKGLRVRTNNTLYIIRKRNTGLTIEGSAKYCPSEVPCSIHGSTWGGSMIKLRFVGRGMHLEFSTREHPAAIVTSAIQTIEEFDLLEQGQ